MDLNALLAAALAAGLAQAALAVAGHFVPWIADNLFALGGAALSAAAGVIYARKAGAGPALAGGALAGLAAALAGVLLAAVLGDVPFGLAPVGAATGALAGLAGAAGRRALAGRIARRPPR